MRSHTQVVQSLSLLLFTAGTGFSSVHPPHFTATFDLQATRWTSLPRAPAY